MIEAAGVDRDLVPTVNGIEGFFWRLVRRTRRRRTEARPEEITKTECVRVVAERQAKHQENCAREFHIPRNPSAVWGSEWRQEIAAFCGKTQLESPEQSDLGSKI